MKRRIAAGLAVAGLGISILVGILAVHVLEGKSLLAAIGHDWTYLLMFLGLFTLGALTIAHQPRNRVSWLFAWTGLLLGMGELSSLVADYAYDYTDPSFVALAAAWISNWVWVIGFGPLATLLILWFPTGRPPSPRWRWAERAAVGVFVPLTLLVAFGDRKSVV